MTAFGRIFEALRRGHDVWLRGPTGCLARIDRQATYNLADDTPDDVVVTKEAGLVSLAEWHYDSAVSTSPRY